MGPQLTDGLTDGPQQFVVGMGFKAPLIGEGEHLVVDTCGITDSQDVDASVDELFRDPVDGHVTLSTNEHLVLTTERLVDGLDEGGGLAGTRRAVNDGDILGAQHLVDGIFLRTIQIGKVDRCEAEGLGRLTGIEEVAQITQTTFRLDDSVEGLEHHLIARLVEEELDAHVFCPLHIDQLTVVGHDHNHSVALDIADCSGKGEVMDLFSAVDAEKDHRFTKLEVMLDLIVLALTEHLDYQLVQRVIVALTHAEGPPGITALHLPLQAHFLGLLAESLFLGLILQLEQKPLLL